MKRPTRKFIIIQVITVTVVILPPVFIRILNAYLRKHLIPCHSLAGCPFDSTFATWINNLINFHFPHDSFMRTIELFWHDFWNLLYEIPYSFAELLSIEKLIRSFIFGGPFFIIFWLIIVNSIYFSLRSLRRRLVKK